MLGHVVKDYRQGKMHAVTQRDLILVNGRYYGYIVGAGLIVNFLQLYYSGARPGPLRAFWLLATCGLSWIFGTSLIKGVVQPFEADIDVDGERIPFRSFSMFLASTVAHIGLGVRPFYLSARKRGYYHLLAGPSSPGELLGKLPRFSRGLPANLDTLYDSMGQRVRIDFAEPQAFTINGDIFEPVATLELEPGPRVSFICG
jgi:diacylglycerol kinase family enzyme